MQILHVTKRKPDGGASAATVRIIRAFSANAGATVYLHHDGTYGYKDGSPVRSRAELDIIPAGPQRDAAHAWWDHIGEAAAAEYAQRRLAAEKRRLEQSLPAAVPDSARDTVMYHRFRAVDDDKGPPRAWMAYAEHRPEWWGAAELIQIGGWIYERADLPAGQKDADAPREEPPAKTDAPGDASGNAPAKSKPAAGKGKAPAEF